MQFTQNPQQMRLSPNYIYTSQLTNGRQCIIPYCQFYTHQATTVYQFNSWLLLIPPTFSPGVPHFRTAVQSLHTTINTNVGKDSNWSGSQLISVIEQEIVLLTILDDRQSTTPIWNNAFPLKKKKIATSA